jgi:hypothetical protein
MAGSADRKTFENGSVSEGQMAGTAGPEKMAARATPDKVTVAAPRQTTVKRPRSLRTTGELVRLMMDEW